MLSIDGYYVDRAEIRMPPVYSIGHSTRSFDELIALLKEHDIELLADVRRYPASRRHPQFNRNALEANLRPAHIEYVWLEDLGGRRSTRKDSHNTAWHNAGFRGYADYMAAATATMAFIAPRRALRRWNIERR